MLTRPSTRGKEAPKSPLKVKIKRSFSFKKEKRSTNNEEDNYLDETQKIPKQTYYKSIEPYFKKKVHISGYEAELRNTCEQSDNSKETKSQKSDSMMIHDDGRLDTADQSPARTRENWYKHSDHTFSRISEEETISDRNSYGINLKPKKAIKRAKTKGTDIKSIVSSYF